MNINAAEKRSAVPPVLVGIAGGSCSGKTTFARLLQALLRPVKTGILNQDAYYRGQSSRDPDTRAKTNFDHPDAIEMPLFLSHLEKLLKGESIRKPVYSYRLHTRTSETMEVHPSKVLIVEGLFLFGMYPAAPLFSLKIFLDVPDAERERRRVARDIQERSDTMEDLMIRWHGQTLPMHTSYVEPQKDFADHVLTGVEDEAPPIAAEIEAILKQR